MEVWTERLRQDLDSDHDFMLGAFDGDALVALAGCYRERAVKQRHVAHLWGVYVTPEYRGTGLGRRIVQAAVERARRWEGLEQLWLDVTTVNVGARALYASCGFRRLGVKPRAIRVGTRYHDEELMGLDLRGPS